MNALRWVLDLECGHELWVTSKVVNSEGDDVSILRGPGGAEMMPDWKEEAELLADCAQPKSREYFVRSLAARTLRAAAKDKSFGTVIRTSLRKLSAIDVLRVGWSAWPKRLRLGRRSERIQKGCL